MDASAAYSAVILAKPWFLQPLGQPLTFKDGVFQDNVFIDFMTETVQKSNLEEFKWAPIHLLSMAVLLREAITIEAYVKASVASRVLAPQLYRANLRLHLDGQILRHLEESLKKLIDRVADNWKEDIAALQQRDSRVKNPNGINAIIVRTDREMEFDKQLGTAPCQIEFHKLKFEKIKDETDRRLKDLITPELGIFNTNFGTLWDENLATHAKIAYEGLPTPKASIKDSHITALFRAFAALLVLKENLRLEVDVINNMVTVDSAFQDRAVLTREEKVKKLWEARKVEFENLQNKLKKLLEAQAISKYKRKLEEEAQLNAYEGNWAQDIKNVKKEELEGTKENFDSSSQIHAEAHIALLMLEKTRERITARLKETEGYLNCLKIIAHENKGMPITNAQKLSIAATTVKDLGGSAINLAYSTIIDTYTSISDWYFTPNKSGPTNGNTGKQ